MLATVHACAVVGPDGHIVDAEVDFNPRAGLPLFTSVGLPDAFVKASRERVSSAIKNSNRAATRRMRGSSQLAEDLTATLSGQNQHEQEEQQFGLQFPNTVSVD